MMENMNMQIESEASDLLDRRMMQLYGVARKEMKLTDLKTINTDVVNALAGDPSSPFGQKMIKKLRSEKLPELGLT